MPLESYNGCRDHNQGLSKMMTVARDNTMKACVCHTAGERKEAAGDADEKGRCFVAALRAECSHRKKKETGWIPQLHSRANSCLGLEGSIQAGRGGHRVDMVVVGTESRLLALLVESRGN